MQSREESAYPRNFPSLLLSGSVSAGGFLFFSISEAIRGRRAVLSGLAEPLDGRTICTQQDEPKLPLEHA